MEYKSKFKAEEIDERMELFISFPEQPSAEWVMETVEKLRNSLSGFAFTMTPLGIATIKWDTLNSVQIDLLPVLEWKQTEPYDRDYIRFKYMNLGVDIGGELRIEQGSARYDLTNPEYSDSL